MLIKLPATCVILFSIPFFVEKISKFYKLYFYYLIKTQQSLAYYVIFKFNKGASS